MLTIFIILSAFGVPVCKAYSVTHEHSFLLHFRFDRSELHRDYMSNGAVLTELKDFLERTPLIDSIAIIAYSSPEGYVDYNKNLSKRRVMSAEKCIRGLLPVYGHTYPIAFSRHADGENWNGLLNELRAGYHRPNRERVLSIVASDMSEEQKKNALRRLDRGSTYNHIVLHYMSRLRYTAGIIVYTTPRFHETPMIAPMVAEAVEPMLPAALPALSVEPTPLRTKRAHTIAALKTNLLFDAVTAVNYSIEIPIANNFSVLFQQNTPWWLTRDNKKCLQLLTLGGEARWWFSTSTSRRQGKDHLLGHFFGAYAYSGKCDLQWNTTGRYQADGWSAGLSYGYSMQINKYFNLELSVAAGFARINWERYTPSDDWQTLFHEDSGILDYFGPTKAEVSIVMPLRIKTKGGKR